MSESLPDHGTCPAMKTQMPGADINAEISLSAAEKLGWLCDVKNGVKILICHHSLWFGVYIHIGCFVPIFASQGDFIQLLKASPCFVPPEFELFY